MIELLRLILHIIASFSKPRTKLVAEILVLRQQLNVLRRQVSKRPQLSNTDRFLLFGSIVGSLPSSARLQFSAQRRSSAGIARGSGRTGAGDHANRLAGREFRPSCAISSARWAVQITSGVHHTFMVKCSSWFHNRAVNGRALYVPGLSAVAGLADLPDQSCRWHRGSRPLRAADDNVPAALLPCDSAPRTSTVGIVRGDDKSDRGVDFAPDHRGVMRRGLTAASIFSRMLAGDG